MDDDIHGPTLFRFNEEEWNSGIQTGNSSFHGGPAKELCVNYEECKIEEALQLSGTTKQIKRDGTATMSNLDHVGVLSPESFITEVNNPLYGNTMPELWSYKEMMIQMRKMIF